MKKIGEFFRELSKNAAQGFMKFMTGRYGSDKLNIALLVAALVLSVISWILTHIISLPLVGILLTLASYVLTGFAVYRCFSRKTYNRYEENRKFLRFWERLKDREHRYFDCPKCRQPTRVPRRKGKIAITCPKCKEKFIRKT